MIHVKPPTNYRGRKKSLFLAGGITGCPDWQKDLVEMLGDTDLALFNPRRKNFKHRDPRASKKQISWEHKHLCHADAISFWFPEETLCPITLYELGAWSMTDKPIFIGCHPKYKRQPDALWQTHLVRPKIKIVDSLEKLAGQIKKWNNL